MLTNEQVIYFRKVRAHRYYQFAICKFKELRYITANMAVINDDEKKLIGHNDSDSEEEIDRQARASRLIATDNGKQEDLFSQWNDVDGYLRNALQYYYEI